VQNIPDTGLDGEIPALGSSERDAVEDDGGEAAGGVAVTTALD